MNECSVSRVELKSPDSDRLSFQLTEDDKHAFYEIVQIAELAGDKELSTKIKDLYDLMIVVSDLICVKHQFSPGMDLLLDKIASFLKRDTMVRFIARCWKVRKVTLKSRTVSACREIEVIHTDACHDTVVICQGKLSENARLNLAELDKLFVAKRSVPAKH